MALHSFRIMLQNGWKKIFSCHSNCCNFCLVISFDNHVRLESQLPSLARDDYFPKTLVKIDDQNVKLCTMSQLLQLNFVKNFLGDGFVNHMLVNELLRNVFDFTSKQLSVNEPYICERKKAGHCSLL